jgi:outer membrane protein TolC
MQYRHVALTVAALLLSTITFGQTIDFADPEEVALAAVSRHPSLERLQAQARAARERASVAAAYPNPMVMGGVQNQPLDLSTDEMMTMYMIGASQTIPRKSRRDALRTIAQVAVEQIELETQSLHEEIRRDALFAWYELAEADSQISATEQVAAAIDLAVAAVRARYEVGSATQAEVIRAQLQRSEIDHQLLTLRGARAAASGRLLTRLDLPLTTEIPRLTLPHATEARSIEHQFVVAETHPALRAAAAEVRMREQDLRLAQLISKPDWSVEASYGMRLEQTDMFSVVARVELPLRQETSVEPQIRAAVAERDAAQKRVVEVRRQINEGLAVASAVHAEASRQLELHERVLVPQSKLAFESTMASYQAGKESFESVLSAESAYLRLQVDFYDFLSRHIKAAVDSEALHRGARFGATRQEVMQ